MSNSDRNLEVTLADLKSWAAAPVGKDASCIRVFRRGAYNRFMGNVLWGTVLYLAAPHLIQPVLESVVGGLFIYRYVQAMLSR